jgi:large subunit ribosomal protein L21
MYAVIALGGKQYRVTPGEYLVVDRLHLDEGASFEPTVLMAGDGDKVLVGADEIAKVKVSATVKSHQKGKKIRVLRYEPKSNWSKRRGHRSYQSVIEIAKIAV